MQRDLVLVGPLIERLGGELGAVAPHEALAYLQGGEAPEHLKLLRRKAGKLSSLGDSEPLLQSNQRQSGPSWKRHSDQSFWSLVCEPSKPGRVRDTVTDPSADFVIEMVSLLVAPDTALFADAF